MICTFANILSANISFESNKSTYFAHLETPTQHGTVSYLGRGFVIYFKYKIIYTKLRWCIFGPTPIRPTAHPTYQHVVLQLLDGLLATAPGPLACPSRGARPPSRSARPRNCLNLT